MTEVVTWNVQRFYQGTEKAKSDIVLIQQACQRAVICLQEFPIGHTVPLSCVHTMIRHQENVIICPSEYTVLSDSIIEAQGKTRSFLSAMLQKRGEDPMTILTGKLTHGPFGRHERDLVLRQLLGRYPDIIALDTNACLGGELAQLRSGARDIGFDSPRSNGATFFPDLLESDSLIKRLLIRFGKPQELDTFFVNGNTHRIRNSRVLTDFYCSDHQPVSVRVRAA